MTLHDEIHSPRFEFKSHDEAHRFLQQQMCRAIEEVTSDFSPPEPTMHTTLVQIARIVFGKLEGSLSHLNLIARVQSLLDQHNNLLDLCNDLTHLVEGTSTDEPEPAFNIFNLRYRVKMLSIDEARLTERLKKAEDMVAKQAGQIHSLRDALSQEEPPGPNQPGAPSEAGPLTKYACWYFKILREIKDEIDEANRPFDELPEMVRCAVKDSNRLQKILNAVNSEAA